MASLLLFPNNRTILYNSHCMNTYESHHKVAGNVQDYIIQDIIFQLKVEVSPAMPFFL